MAYDSSKLRVVLLLRTWAHFEAAVLTASASRTDLPLLMLNPFSSNMILATRQMGHFGPALSVLRLSWFNLLLLPLDYAQVASSSLLQCFICCSIFLLALSIACTGPLLLMPDAMTCDAPMLPQRSAQPEVLSITLGMSRLGSRLPAPSLVHTGNTLMAKSSFCSKFAIPILSCSMIGFLLTSQSLAHSSTLPTVGGVVWSSILLAASNSLLLDPATFSHSLACVGFSMSVCDPVKPESPASLRCSSWLDLVLSVPFHSISGPISVALDMFQLGLPLASQCHSCSGLPLLLFGITYLRTSTPALSLVWLGIALLSQGHTQLGFTAPTPSHTHFESTSPFRGSTRSSFATVMMRHCHAENILPFQDCTRPAIFLPALDKCYISSSVSLQAASSSDVLLLAAGTLQLDLFTAISDSTQLDLPPLPHSLA